MYTWEETRAKRETEEKRHMRRQRSGELHQALMPHHTAWLRWLQKVCEHGPTIRQRGRNVCAGCMLRLG